MGLREVFRVYPWQSHPAGNRSPASDNAFRTEEPEFTTSQSATV